MNEVTNETPNKSNNEPTPNDQENQPPLNHRKNKLSPFDLNIDALCHSICIHQSPSYLQNYHCLPITHYNLLLYRPLLTIYRSKVVFYALHKFISNNTLYFKKLNML